MIFELIRLLMMDVGSLSLTLSYPQLHLYVGEVMQIKPSGLQQTFRSYIESMGFGLCINLHLQHSIYQEPIHKYQFI